jgi:hypothetical protein
MKVTVSLNLPKAYNKLEVRYNTFDKVAYDQYFIASLVRHSKSEDKAFLLIDELTGKGSLNQHFKKIYQEINKLSNDEFDSILKDSLYPVQKIDNFRYMYIPSLDISVFDKNIMQGNLKNDEFFPKQLVGENGTYVAHTYMENDPTTKQDIYEVNLEENKTEIRIHDQFCSIDPSLFQKIVNKEELDLNQYKGIIHQNIEGNNWFQLNKSSYNNIINSTDYYYENGNHFGIFNNFVRESHIAYIWGIYWVKEKSHYYNDISSKDICENAVNKLLETGRINEFKTKSLLAMLNNIDRNLQQEVINYVLKRKDSKELASVAFILIDKGYEKGWNEEAFKALYKFNDSNKQLTKLYEINSEFTYSLEDLLAIDRFNKTKLIDKHKKIVDEHYSKCEDIRKDISRKIGDVMSSGIREQIKDFDLTSDTKKLRKLINDNGAHNKKNIQKMDLNQLIQYSKTIDAMYDLYLKVKVAIEQQIKNHV